MYVSHFRIEESSFSGVCRRFCYHGPRNQQIDRKRNDQRSQRRGDGVSIEALLVAVEERVSQPSIDEGEGEESKTDRPRSQGGKDK
jgi:hypothetical protein